MIILKIIQKKINIYSLSENEGITWECIQQNPILRKERWYFTYVSRNPNITWDIIKNNPDRDWYAGNICQNRNITWDMIHEIPEDTLMSKKIDGIGK